jgi:hypothetical protein
MDNFMNNKEKWQKAITDYENNQMIKNNFEKDNIQKLSNWFRDNGEVACKLLEVTGKTIWFYSYSASCWAALNKNGIEINNGITVENIYYGKTIHLVDDGIWLELIKYYQKFAYQEKDIIVFIENNLNFIAENMFNL